MSFGSVAAAIGNGTASAISTVGSAVENGVTAVVDTGEDAAATVGDAAASIPDAINDADGASGNPVVAVIGASVAATLVGIVNVVRDVGGALNSMVRDGLGVIGGLARGDFGYALSRLGDMFIDLVKLAGAVFRFVTFGYVVSAFIKYTNRSRLRAFVETLLANTFGAGSATLDAIRRRLGLTGVNWGLNLPSTHKRFMLDSATMDAGPTPLWQLHQSGVIDLYALAGLWSSDQPGDSFRVWLRPTPTTVVNVVSPDGTNGRRPGRLFLSTYINDNSHPGRFRIYAMSRRAIAEHLRVATDKVAELGVNLSWNDGERFSWMRGYSDFEITTPAEMRFDVSERPDDNTANIFSAPAGSYLINKGLRTATPADDGLPLAFSVFQYEPADDGTVGMTEGCAITENSNSTPCATAGRTDLCCSIIARATTIDPNNPQIPSTPLGSGVFHRDFWPAEGSRYILAHELGHHLGLGHPTHTGPDNIMFSPKVSHKPGVWIAGTIFSYWLSNEPNFTLRDGLNSWRFLVNQMPHVL